MQDNAFFAEPGECWQKRKPQAVLRVLQALVTRDPYALASSPQSLQVRHEAFSGTGERTTRTCLLDFVDGGPGEHVQSIVARKMDVAFLTGARVPSGCDAELVWSEPVFVALPSEHRLATERSIPLKAIAAEMFIISRAAPGPEIHDYVVRHLSELGRHPDVGYHAVGRETLMAMVGLGIGVSLVSGAEAGVQYPGVTFIPLAGEQLPFSMIWLAQNDNPALRRFLSAARVHARSQQGRDVAPR